MWYNYVGLWAGVTAGFFGLALLVAIIREGWLDKSTDIPVLAVTLTAWYWLPWLLYWTTFIHQPPGLD